MPRAKATDGLSAEGQNAMARGFAAGWTAERIAQAVLDATGEVVAERTVSRRMAEWRESKARFERAKEQYRAMKEAGLDGVQMLQSLAFEKLLDDPDALTGSDPLGFHALGLEAEKVALKKREIEVRERAVAIDERRIKLLEDREGRAIAALTKVDAELTDEQRVDEVRSILNLPARKKEAA
jgi:hypothetical protein